MAFDGTYKEGSKGKRHKTYGEISLVGSRNAGSEEEKKQIISSVLTASRMRIRMKSIMSSMKA